MKQGWTISTIGSVAKVFNGNSINAEEKKAKYEGLEEGYPFIATKDVGVNGEVDYDNGVKIPFDTDFKIAMPDAVFVCAEGGSAGKKVAHIDRKVCFGNKLFALQPIKEKVKGGFLYYAVQEAGFKAQFRLSMAGIIGGVSAKKFNSITIPIPPLSEQQRIVALLDAEFAKIDALKANAEKNLQNAKDLFQAALKKELEPKKGWTTKCLNDIYDVRDGTHDSPKYVSDGYPFVTSKNLVEGKIDMSNIKYISKEDYDKINERSKVDKGDVLFAMIGSNLGHPALVEEEPNYAIKNVALFKVPSDQSSRLLLYLLSSDMVMSVMNKEKNGSSQPFVSLKYLRNFKVSVPKTREEQERLAEEIQRIYDRSVALKANYEKTIALCDDLKQALLRKTFNGEI